MTPEQRRKMDLTLARFVDSMTAWNRSRKTIISYEQNLRYFINWLHTETDVATLAIATDEPSALQTSLPALPLGDIDCIGEFICRTVGIEYRRHPD